MFTKVFFKRTIKPYLYLDWGIIVQKHHLYWPRRAFNKSNIAKQFRNLACNIVILTAEEHRAIHAQRRASDMPTREQMLQQLELCKDCRGDCNANHKRWANAD